MTAMQNALRVHHLLLPCVSTQLGLYRHGKNQRGVTFLVKSEQVHEASISPSQVGRRQLLALGATLAPLLFLSCKTPASFAAETKKGFLPVTDKTDGYSFLYPFGWQEVVIEGQEKVFKDVIEPLESVSVNMFATGKEDIRDLGSPQEVAETLIKKVLVPPSQKAKLIEASEHDVEGKAYYTFEFVAQAPNFTRHALTSVCIGNGRMIYAMLNNSLCDLGAPAGKFYTLTTGANERRWDKVKERLHTVIDSFQIFKV